MRYYRNFWIFMNNPIAGAYLRWVYKKGVEDLLKLNFKPNFNTRNFVCLLCGVANERTADEFIKFTFEKNPNAKIIIIDRGTEQINAVRKLVKKKYSGFNIQIEQIDALDLQKIILPESLDWIETDAFLEFFDVEGLDKLFNVWHSLLKPTGFITTRDYVTNGPIGKINDTLRIWQMRIWLGVETFAHSPTDFANLFEKFNFKAIEGSTFLPTFKRFSLIKK